MQLPDYYEFFNQSKIISGNKALEHIPFELISMDVVRPMVLTSKKAARGLSKQMVKAFYDSNIIIGALFDDVPDYAGFATVRDLAQLFRDRGCDSIIAIGGGAVCDVAKGLNIVISERNDDLFSYAGDNCIPGPLKPLVFVVTVSLSGTEITGSAKIDGRSFKSDFLYPDLTVIDPRMTRGCCPGCVAETALISLTHSLEASMFGMQSPMTDAYSHAALQFLSENMKKGVKKPGSKTTSLALANAASFSCIAYANAPESITHILSEELAKETGLSLGTCMGMLLTACLEYRLGKKSKMRDDVLLAIAGMDIYSKTPERNRAEMTLTTLRKLLKVMKKIIPASLRAVNIPRYKLQDIAKAASQRGPKGFSEKDFQNILDMVY